MIVYQVRMIALYNNFQMILHRNTACLEFCQICGLAARKQVNQTGMDWHPSGLRRGWQFLTVDNSVVQQNLGNWLQGAREADVWQQYFNDFSWFWLRCICLTTGMQEPGLKKSSQPEEQHGFRGGLCLKEVRPVCREAALLGSCRF